MSLFSKKQQILLIIFVVLIITISLFNFFNKNFIMGEETSQEYDINVNEIIEELENEELPMGEEPQEIMIHISGQVYKPGIVVIKSGSRVIDAVDLAGGLKKDADLDKINLAKKLSDEEKIYIPKIGEEDIPIQGLNYEESLGVSNKVNINTSTKDELLSLPGIGEVIADKIIKYRNQNIFKNIEDIMNVSGIGEKKFESIKELITVQ